MIYSLAATVICLAMLIYELNRHSALKPFSSIRINQQENWQLVNREGKLENIMFKNFMWLGSVLFILFTLNGKRQRVMVFVNQQESSHCHKLKVYLKNI